MRKLPLKLGMATMLVMGCLLPVVQAIPRGITLIEETIVIDVDTAVPDDRYGSVVAFDGNFVAIGTPDGESSVGSIGIVRIFSWSGLELVEVGEVNSGAASSGDEFAFALAMRGGTLVVGAPSGESSGVATGRVYVYDVSESAIVLVDVLRPGDLTVDQRYGSAVAVDGDIVLAGSPFDTTDPAGTGSVTVHRRDGTRYVQEAQLSSSQPVVDSDFGVAIDFDGDRAIIGESRGISSSGLPEVGAAEIYYRDAPNLTWSMETRLDPVTVESGSRFGHAVAIDGTLAAVGAPEQDSGAGLLTIYFNDSPGVWTSVNTTSPSDLAAADGLGTSVGIADSRVYAGAPLGTGGDFNTGCVHIFEQLGGNFVETQRLIGSDDLGSDFAQVGIAIDVVGNEAIVGAPDFNSNRGLALLYANDVSWTAAGGGSWFDPASWSVDSIPTAETPVHFGLAGTIEVIVEKWAVCESLEAHAGTLTFILDDAFAVIEAANAGITIGSTGSAQVAIEFGVLTTADSLVLGLESGANGDLTLTDAIADIGGDIIVGQEGSGRLFLSGVAEAFGTEMIIGAGDGSSSVTVGVSSLLNLSGDDPQDYAINIINGVLAIDGGDVVVGTQGIMVEENGRLGGFGEIDGSLVNRGILFCAPSVVGPPALSPLHIDGNYNSTGGSGIDNYKSANTWVYYDESYAGHLTVGGTAYLSGPMSIEVPEGLAVPPAGTSIPLVTASEFSGDFSTYFVPGFGDNRWVDIKSLAMSQGSSIMAELDVLPLPFGFNPPVDGPVGVGDPESIKVFDVDGDGDPDVVVLIRSVSVADAILVFENTNGTLCPHGQIAVGDDPSDFTVADFDGDGDPDLAVTCLVDDQIEILINNGAGQFSTGLTLTALNDPSDLCVFNYDDDGHPDLAVVNAGSNSLYVFRNTAAFRGVAFDPPIVHATGLAPSGVRPGQVGSGANDKTDDIVVANVDGTVDVFINLNGSFDTPSSHIMGTVPIGGMTVTDLDLDGLDDILVTLGTSGCGVLYSPPGNSPVDLIDMVGTGIVQVDLDLDGDDDGVIPGGLGLRGSIPIHILRNDSDMQDGGEVVLVDVPAGTLGVGGVVASAGDIDGDSRPDLVFLKSTAPDSFQIAVGTSTAIGAPPWDPGVCPVQCPGDVNGDSIVNVDDVLALLSSWGLCSDCPADFDFDGDVDVDDLLFLLTGWGPC